MIDPMKGTVIHQTGDGRVFIQKGVVVISQSALQKVDGGWEIKVETLRRILKSHDEWFEKWVV